MFKDELEIARIQVGVTPEKELNSFVQPLNYHGPAGYQVPGESGATLHCYTNVARNACLFVTCRKKIAQKVRLGRGLWSPLAELATIPDEAISDCSLNVMGSGAMACLGSPGDGMFSGKPRVLQVYGPPTREQGDRLEYDWPFPPRPRKMWFRVKGDTLVEMCLELMEDTPPQFMRPLGPPADFQRMTSLPARLEARLQEGDEWLRKGEPARAEPLYRDVLEALNEADLDPNFLKADVATRLSLAQAMAGQGDPVERIRGVLAYQETYVNYNPPEVLRTRLALSQAHRLTGNQAAARQELLKLWELLQASRYYQEPETQSLVRRTAAELELVGEPRYAEEIRRMDAAR